MNKIKLKQEDIGNSPNRSSMTALRGRQSVRATFRLSEECIDAISILAAQLGIKQKSVFDHLMEDVQTLKDTARALADADFNRNDSIQKSFVISRRSLTFLDTISSQHNAPRDALVEYSVRRLIPIIANERKKHEQRKKLLSEISEHYEKGQALLGKAKESLNQDDPLVNKLKTAVTVYRNALDDITNFIEKGKIIESFNPE